MIIVLEGLEGVGKTSLATGVSTKLGIANLKTPPPVLNPVREVIARSNSRIVNFYFYLTGLLMIQPALKQYKGASSHVILDRYLHSTIAYHDNGNSFAPPPYPTTELLSADLTVHITCAEADRERRKRERGFHIFERTIKNDARIESYFREIANQEFENNTTLDASIDELAAFLSRWLSKQIDTFRKQ